MEDMNQAVGCTMKAKDSNEINPIIIDFIKSRDDVEGCGYFKGNREAIRYAQTVGKTQERKFRKYGIVPKSLVRMIGQYFVIQKKRSPIYRNIMYDEFMTILIRGPYKSEAARQIGEKFYRDLLVAQMPWLERSFATMDGSFNLLEN
jgi:hypothetical protein